MTSAPPGATGSSPAVSLCVERLRRRADFLAAARGRRAATPGFVLQGRDRGDGGPIRVGFTCSRKVGNAVARNRAKRRLRELARAELPRAGHAGWDYVLIGRAGTTGKRDFATMREELRAALEQVHARGGPAAGRPRAE